MFGFVCYHTKLRLIAGRQLLTNSQGGSFHIVSVLCETVFLHRIAMCADNLKMEVRKSLRHSNSDSKLHYTHGYTNDYKLNIEKSLKKKLESTKRSDIIYEITRGGITMKLDAVSFEVFVYACEQYYDIETVSNYDFRKTTATDKQGNNVQYTYHINRTRPEPKSFTINAYLTKCSLLINAKTVSYSSIMTSTIYII